MRAGYSKTPLWKKIGFKKNISTIIINPYSEYFEDIAVPFEIQIIQDLDCAESHSIDLIHYFGKSKSELDKTFHSMKNILRYNGSLWISWPKKAAKIFTDIDGNKVRKIGLKNGLVDIKVAAISEIWSGLKFMFRKEDRK